MSQLSEAELKEFYRNKTIKQRDEHKQKMTDIDGQLVQKKLKYDITDQDWDQIVALIREYDGKRRLYMYAQIKLSPFMKR